MIDREHLAARCLSAHKTLTPQRMQILEALSQSQEPCSAYALKDNLARDGLDYNISTIYRVLEFWESLQIVHKLTSNNTYVLCQDEHAEHVHVIQHCQRCAATVEDCETSQALQLPKTFPNDGFQADLSQVIELTGLCQQCQAHGNMN